MQMFAKTNDFWSLNCISWARERNQNTKKKITQSNKKKKRSFIWNSHAAVKQNCVTIPTVYGMVNNIPSKGHKHLAVSSDILFMKIYVSAFI